MGRAWCLPLALAVVAGTAAVRFGATPLLAPAALLLFGPRAGFALRAASVTLCALAALNAQLRGEPAFAPADARSRIVLGTIVERSGALDAERWVLRLDDDHSLPPQLRGALVTATLQGSGTSGPPAGARVRLRARYEPPSTARNPGEPSPRELARERGLAGALVQAHLLARLPEDARDAHLWLPRARAWAGAQLRGRLDEPYATILAGAMWGERGALPPDLRREFQDTGTVHVLVTAGLHLGVVAALALWLLARLGCGRIGASLGAIAVVWLYAAFSGAHLPSLRAATMASFALAARASGRVALSWNALSLAAIVVGLARPWSVTSLSFALSFSCVAAILLFAEPFAAAFARVRVPGLAAEALALTCATQVGTWPLTASAFLTIAPYAPLANALVVPSVGIAMLLGLAQLAAAPVAPLAQALANANALVLAWIVAVVRCVGSLPGAHLSATPPPPWSIALYDAAILGCALLLRPRSDEATVRRGRPLLAAALFAGATALALWPPRPAARDLEITAIDVGQADALLVRTPSGASILVDAGGRLERGASPGTSPAEAVGERVVVPFLIRHGVHRLDAVILSHPHGDHAGGLAPVLRLLGAATLLDGAQVYAGHAYHEGLDAARAGGTRIVIARAGMDWIADGVAFRVLSPSEPFITGSRNDINANSIVFMLEYRCPQCATPFRMLFTGDAGSETEARLLASGADLRADVLKVGHHGSAYGTTPAFVRAVAPHYAIVSVGRDNRFGHPAASTLETLRAAGVEVYRTDERGAVTVRAGAGALALRATL